MASYDLPRILPWMGMTLAVGLWAPPALAQSVWVPQDRDGAVRLELQRPSLEGEGQDLLFGAVFVGVSAPLSPSVHLLLEVAVARTAFEQGGFDVSEWGLASPYVGVELGRDGGSGSFELGVRLPVAGGDGLFAGFLSDVERRLAFLEDAVVVSGLGRLTSTRENNVFTVLRFGPEILVPTEEVGDTELFLTYSGVVGYEGERVSVGGGLVGQFLATGEGGGFGDRSVHELSVRGSVELASVRPHLELRFPVDDSLDAVVDFTLGLGLTVPLG